jgi:high affinity Mn2+ porin
VLADPFSGPSMHVRSVAVFSATFVSRAAAASLVVQTLGAQASPRAPAIPPPGGGHDWSGWYAGGLVGYTQGTAALVLADPRPAAGSNPLGYTHAGLYLGYAAVRRSRFLFGGEVDLSVPDFFEDGVVSSRATGPGGSVTEKLDLVSSVRGRVGYTLDRWLIYGTGGMARSGTRLFEHTATGIDSTRLPGWRAGWSVGGGTELAIAPGWAARLEYLYSRLGQAGGVFPSGTTVESRLDVHSVRLGLSTRLGGQVAGATPNTGGHAAEPDSARWNFHAQDTFIEQGYFKFRSPYEGTNSLTGASQTKDTESATAFLGVRLWPGAEAYFNPEIDQGQGLNTTHGVSAFPNGEAQKASFPMPRFVVDRLLLRQTFGLGGERQTITDGPNQLAGAVDVSRVTIVAGRLAVTDYFDVNAYANDPRTNFLNWNIYGAGAYDWTMDQISWTYGAMAELNQKRWAFRAGYFLLPIVSSNNSFDLHIPARGEYTAEVERRYSLGSQPGRMRLFGWVNHGTMGGYADALALPASTPNYPDITLTRTVRTNPGVVLNAEQAITDDVGLFSRASWSPGRVEILGGTDCSASVSFGGVFNGRQWGRPADRLGLSGVVGGLSPVARDYFAAGGTGILIGDGGLTYRTERVLEGYYAVALNRWATVSLDYQFVTNPGYNAVRGPVSIYAVRVHAAL